jgi:uncharacterized protein GlcG (DUF336 family)
MSNNVYRAAGVALVSALAFGLAPANAQTLAHKDLSLGMATTIALTAIETCKANGYNVSAHVLGREGQVIVALRNEGAGLGTWENSMKKAYTARTFARPSGEFANGVKGNPTAIKIGNDTIGAIGISGAPGGDKDEACAKAGIDKVSADLK